jgi:pimeloyl-ACP methyl ester carboxylesterase
MRPTRSLEKRECRRKTFGPIGLYRQNPSVDTFPEISLPLPEHVDELTMRDGAIIRLRRFGKSGGIRLALSHGNGLAINLYAPFWMPLAERFEIIVFDIRNHGENPLHDPRLHNWTSIIADFEEIFQGIQAHYGMRPTIGVFHSLSAIAALNHALAYGARWRALALFDPAIFPATDTSCRRPSVPT